MFGSSRLFLPVIRLSCYT